MALPDYSAQAEALQGHLHEVGTEAHRAGSEMKTMSDRLLEWGKLALAGQFLSIVKQMTGNVVTQRQQAQMLLENAKKQRGVEQERLGQHEEILEAMRMAGNLDPQMLRTQTAAVNAARQRVAYANQNVTALQGTVANLSRMNLLIGLGICLVEAEYALWKNILDATHRYNRALMQTTTDYAARFALLRKVVDVQGELGAKTEDMAEATEALVEYGHDLSPAFQQNLRIVVMMKEALAISARTGAEMVTIFSRQLQTSAQSIADVMAEVAANTSLAAEKAAQFAIEIGRSLRLFGPGVGTQATDITRMVETLAGKVNEMGGNARSIVEMHRRLVGVESESFFMRGIAGTSLSALRTGAGTEAALRNANSYLQARIGRPGGTEAEQTRYMLLVQAFSQTLNMSSTELIDFMQSMDLLRNTTSKAVSIEDAWRKQTTLLGDAFGKIKMSMFALVEQAMLPLLESLTPLIADFASLAQHFAHLPSVIKYTRLAIEEIINLSVKHLLGPSTNFALSVAKYFPGLKNLDLLQELKAMISEWKADWTQDSQKQQEFVLLSAQTKSDTQVAADKFTEVALAKNEADRVRLSQQFVEALRKASESEGTTQEQVAAMAAEAFKSGAFTEMLQRGHTVKTEEEVARDKYLEATYKQIDFLRLQYEQMKKDAAVDSQKAAQEAQKAQEEHDRWLLSHVISPEQLTQAPAYMIQRNVPSFHQ